MSHRVVAVYRTVTATLRDRADQVMGPLQAMYRVLNEDKICTHMTKRRRHKTYSVALALQQQTGFWPTLADYLQCNYRTETIHSPAGTLSGTTGQPQVSSPVSLKECPTESCYQSSPRQRQQLAFRSVYKNLIMYFLCLSNK